MGKKVNSRIRRRAGAAADLTGVWPGGDGERQLRRPATVDTATGAAAVSRGRRAGQPEQAWLSGVLWADRMGGFGCLMGCGLTGREGSAAGRDAA